LRESGDVPCGLLEDELDVLLYLYVRRCLGEKHSKASKAIERDFRDKQIDPLDVLRRLRNKHYVGMHKKDHYYADAGRTMRALRGHRPWVLPPERPGSGQ
jgi:hypothetical protein